MTTRNVAAFLATVRHSEGTARALDPYRVVYGFTHTIKDLSDHPALTGEWTGVQTKWGHTSAAGAYQIEVRTWIDCKNALRLTDFTPTSQDDAAIYLIKEKGALMLVNNGQVSDAIARCHPIWASLPGSTAGQPITPIASLMKAYINAGGAYARGAYA